MKWLFILISLLFFSCKPFYINTQDYSIKSMSLDEAWKIVSSYTYIHEDTDYWKSPNEFIKDGGGDCEDFSCYLVYLLGKDASMISYKTVNSAHVIVKYKGKYIEPQIYGEYFDKEYIESHEMIEIDYDIVMYYFTNYGTKRLIWK